MIFESNSLRGWCDKSRRLGGQARPVRVERQDVKLQSQLTPNPLFKGSRLEHSCMIQVRHP